MTARAQGIPIIGKLLLMHLLVATSSARIYQELPWLQEVYDDPQPVPELRLTGPTLVNVRDLSYLPEDSYEDEKTHVDIDDPDERLNRNDRSLLPEYRSLCETATRKVDLKNDPTYEYQPPHYHEVFCKSYSLMDDEPQKAVVPLKQKCAHPSFHCVQRSRTLFMARRRWDAECWEPITRVVASGCDCMWPVSTLGDVSIHY